MATELPDLVRRLLDGSVHVVLSTVNPDGSPQSSVIWAKRDGDEVVFSTVYGRRKTSNMRREPRVSLCGFDPVEPLRSFEIRGTVTLTEEGGDALIDELSRAYQGRTWVESKPVTRLVCRVAPTAVALH